MKPSLLDRWEKDAMVRGMAQKTIDGYRYSLLYFEKSIRKPIAHASKMDLRAFVDVQRKDGLTTKTISGRLNALSSFYEFLIFEGIRKDNPVIEIRKRYLSRYKTDSEEHTHKLISIQEAIRLVANAFDPRDKALLMVLLKTGVRRGEALRMDVSDINFEVGQILLKPTKKRSNLIVLFDDETAQALHRWLEVRTWRSPYDDALWISTTGRRIGKGAVDYIVRQAAMRASLHDPKSARMEDHFSAHCCRHFFSTHLRRAGMPREFIQELRGDVRREAIDIYDHISAEELRESYLAHIPRLM